jgi:protein-S-isoprenylcysteine O-methyltransferase Ste14
MNKPQPTITPRVVIQVLLVIVVLPLLPLLISWRWGWWEAWLFAAICILSFAISRALAARRHPDVLAERARSLQQEDTKPWDKILAPLVGLGGGLVPLIAGLEARFGEQLEFGLPLKVLALVFMLAGYALGSYALIENRFFSGVVRIQSERGHQVISSGPYRWVRHPAYAGGLLSYLGMPLLLDSRWAFVPVILMMIAIVIRTHLEDRTLQAELAGYRDYARRVRYRLLPGVW